MSQFWSQLVQRLHPYVPGEQRADPEVIKLNTNENPYPPCIGVQNAIREIDHHVLRKYPDPESTTLRQALARYHDVSIEQVYVGNGSDEILGFAFMAFFTDQPLQYPSVSYSFYPVYCDLFGIEKHPVELSENFAIVPERFKVGLGGIVFPNPNAPTGMALSLEQIELLVTTHADSVVLIDEAYADFGSQSAIGLIHKYNNLVVTRTFSKGRSLAGLRIGAVFAHPDLIEGIKRVKNSFNSYPLDSVAQGAAVASLEDEVYYQRTIQLILNTRKRTVEALEQRQFRVLNSAANFIFVSPGKADAKSLFDYLANKNILVRHWNNALLKDWIRITIGTDSDMDRLVNAIDTYGEHE
ncbi:MAG: histidinol-phosphate transaminase [Gammaproteobacteria bacterium]|nr:histidinol-phosphate transaminase [Gammaproteobacteria bacterium]